MAATAIKMDYTELVLTDREKTNDGMCEEVSFETKDKPETGDSEELQSKYGRRMKMLLKPMWEQIVTKSTSLVKNNWKIICTVLLVLAVLLILAVILVRLSTGNSLRAQINSMAEKYEKEIALLKENQTILEGKLTSMTSLHQKDLKQLNEQMQEQDKRFEASAEAYRETITSEVADLEKQMNSSNRALNMEVAAVNKELRSLSKTVSKQHMEVAANFSTTQNDITFLNEALAETNRESAANFSEVLSRGKQMQKELDEVNDEVKLVSTNLHSLRVETHTNISKVSKSCSDSLQKLQEKLTSSDSQLSKALDKIKEVETSSTKATGDNERKISILANRVDQLEKDKANTATSFSDHESRIKETESKLRSHDHTLNQLESEHGRRLQQVEQAQAFQNGKDEAQDERISQLESKINRLASSGHQHTVNPTLMITLLGVMLFCIVL